MHTITVTAVDGSFGVLYDGQPMMAMQSSREIAISLAQKLVAQCRKARTEVKVTYWDGESETMPELW